MSLYAESLQASQSDSPTVSDEYGSRCDDQWIKGLVVNVSQCPDSGKYLYLNSSGLAEIIAATGMTLRAKNINIESETLTHNGKNIGYDHTHKDVVPGSGNSGEPT